jgi:hypothetical protein
MTSVRDVQLQKAENKMISTDGGMSTRQSDLQSHKPVSSRMIDPSSNITRLIDEFVEYSEPIHLTEAGMQIIPNSSGSHRFERNAIEASCVGDADLILDSWLAVGASCDSSFFFIRPQKVISDRDIQWSGNRSIDRKSSQTFIETETSLTRALCRMINGHGNRF